jgi:hypothetical protein
MSPLTPSGIDQLLQGMPVTNEWPGNTNDEWTVERTFRRYLAEVCRTCQVRERTEWTHYGSGYASYIDRWLYRETDEFHRGPRNWFSGLIVLFSRLSGYFVLGEGEKSWRSHGGSSYTPAFNNLDNIKTPAVVELVEPVCAVLKARGLVRV